MNKRKEWKDYDIVRPEDAQRWEDKPDWEEVKTIVEETGGGGNSSEAVEEVKGDLDEHLKDKKNPHETTAEQVGAYTKEEIGDFEELKTESKENLVSAINELKNDTAEIADTSVKTISIGKGLDRVVHYPDENGDINFSDDFYVPNRGKVIAEGDMPTFKKIDNHFSKSDTRVYFKGRIEVSDLLFTLNVADLNNYKGIAVDFDIAWYHEGADFNWDDANKTIIPINKLSSIPENDFSSVYFKVSDARMLNTMLFEKDKISIGSEKIYLCQTVYGQFVRRYETGISVDNLLKEHLNSGNENFINSYALIKYGDKAFKVGDYKQDSNIDMIGNREEFFYTYNMGMNYNYDLVSKGNSLSMLLNIENDILNVVPIPLTYYGFLDDKNTIESEAMLNGNLTIMMVPTKIYYYD